MGTMSKLPKLNQVLLPAQMKMTMESQRVTTPPEMSKPVRHTTGSFSDSDPMRTNPDRFSGAFAKASDPLKPLRSKVGTTYEPLSNKMQHLLTESGFKCVYVDKRKLVTLGVTKALRKRRTRYEVMGFLRDCFWEKLPRHRKAFLKRFEETLNNIAEQDSDRYRRIVSTIYSTLEEANII